MIKRFLLWLAHMLIARYTPLPSADRIEGVVANVMRELGYQAFKRELTFKSAREAYSVLKLAGDRLGLDIELDNAGDVIDWLKEAPRKK